MNLKIRRPHQISPEEARETLASTGIHLLPSQASSEEQVTRAWEIVEALRTNSSFIYIDDHCYGILSYHAPQYIFNFGDALKWDQHAELVAEALSIPNKVASSISNEEQGHSFPEQNETLSKKEALIPYLVTTSTLPLPATIMKWIKNFNLRPVSFLEGWEVTLDDYVTWIENHPLKYEYLVLKKIRSTDPSDKVFSSLLSLDRTLRGLRRSRALEALLNLEGMDAFVVLRERKPIGYAVVDTNTGMIGPLNTINDELVDVLALLGVEILSNMKANSLCFYTHSLSLIDESAWLESNFKIVKILNTFMSDFIGRFDFYIAPNLLML